MSRLSIVQHRNPSKKPVDGALTVVRYNNEFSSAVYRSNLFERRKDSHRKSLMSSKKMSLSNMNSHGIVSFEEISQWLKTGNVSQLECLLLKGKAHLLDERDELRDETNLNGDFIHPDAKEFIASMPEYKQKVDLLLEAICMGDERTVAETVTYRACILARHPQTLASTVHLAVIHNHLNVLQILIACPLAPLHSRDSEGRCPLHYAAVIAGTLVGSDSKCYDMLVDKKANENAVDYEGYTPKYFFRAPKLIDIRQVRGLNQCCCTVRKLPAALGDEIDQMIGERNLAGLRKLVLSGHYEAANIQGRIFPLNCLDLALLMENLNLRIQAIHEAIKGDDFATLKQLLDSVEMATGSDQFGRTPLHLAVIHGREKMVHYMLLLFPSCVDFLDRDGRSAVHYATNISDADKKRMMARLLFRAGAANSAKNSTTNLMSAFGKRRLLPVSDGELESERQKEQEALHAQMNTRVDGPNGLRSAGSSPLSPYANGPHTSLPHSKHKRHSRSVRAKQKDSSSRLSEHEEWRAKRKSIVATTPAKSAMFFPGWQSKQCLTILENKQAVLNGKAKGARFTPVKHEELDENIDMSRPFLVKIKRKVKIEVAKDLPEDIKCSIIEGLNHIGWNQRLDERKLGL